jgi:prepilin-type N-terminal cleavage/methylation domain-containing protein
MKMNTKPTACRDRGFTLPEIIVAITVVGILGAMTVQFMASALEDSTLPIQIVQDDARRISVMENIISDYVAEINKSAPANALTTMKAKADNGDYNAAGTTVTMSWIDFDGSGQEISGGSDYLKVAVNTNNAGMIAILSKTRTDAADPKASF